MISMNFSSLNAQELANTAGEWLRGSGPESDIVISSRIRLARNLADFPFISRATDTDRAEIGKILRGRIERLHEEGKFTGQLIYVDVSALEAVDRQFLVERQLISREHADAEGARAVVIDQREQMSVMINEEDHLRIQVLQKRPRFGGRHGSRSTSWTIAIEARITYAYNDRFGYLTACPTNVGTGVRVSVMLHLPALVITRQIDKVFRSLQKINLAVRGLYGEGSQAQGDFYQVSNQVTLGQSEEELTKKVSDVVPVLIDYERKARDFLIRESQETLHDRVSRAYGILPHGPDDQFRRNYAPAFEPADGRKSRSHSRRGDSDREQAFRSYAAGPSAKADWHGA